MVRRLINLQLYTTAQRVSEHVARSLSSDNVEGIAAGGFKDRLNEFCQFSVVSSRLISIFALPDPVQGEQAANAVCHRPRLLGPSWAQQWRFSLDSHSEA